MRRALATLLLLVLAGAAACGSNGSTSEAPPWGLGSAALPDDETGIEAVITAMPERVGGLERTVGTEGIAAYGEDAGVMGFRLGPRTEDTPAGTASEYLRLLSTGELALSAGEMEKEEENLEGPLVYIVFNRVANGRHLYTIAFGVPDSETVFVVSAGSPVDREALVRAFVEATS
ncbi:MAG TPA: hypothetical protein VF984_02580 [Actinomycetota bacterium]